MKMEVEAWVGCPRNSVGMEFRLFFLLLSIPYSVRNWLKFRGIPLKTVLYNSRNSVTFHVRNSVYLRRDTYKIFFLSFTFSRHLGHGDNVHLAHYRQHPVAIELGRVSRMLHQVSREKMDESPIQSYKANVDTETAGAITDKGNCRRCHWWSYCRRCHRQCQSRRCTEGAIAGDFTVKAIADVTDVAE